MSGQSNPRARGVASRRAGFLVLLPVIAALFGALPTPAANADEFVWSVGAWNGKKVYLSPARHPDTGSRHECDGASENSMALATARAAADGVWVGNASSDWYDPNSGGRSLAARSYQIRIGGGTVNTAINNSNTWGTHVHIPIHSNAQIGCNARTSASQNGTVVIYGSSASNALSGHVLTTHKQSSPGTNDYKCSQSSSCTAYSTLAELSQTTAVASYLEAEFHTWSTGVAWLSSGYQWGWRIGWAVDSYLGYPRP